ncbi:MAG TPA: nitrite/sulfite reductase [Acidimicrobiales bacterium]|nr:nitrite/sulfite reductase [Acidimicrobiales bacterium]
MTIAEHPVISDPLIAKDVARFEMELERYLANGTDDDRFRVFRLGNGIYGQRQGGTNQMVRVKIPYGGINPDQLEMMAHIADTYSRGWGHITTRQNIQFHFVELTRVPAVLRDLGSVGMTTREACGDTVRNVMGCHLAGSCPFEVLDITPWAEATFRYFVRHPYAQRLPRKFKINFSGCATDCGQAMFNDVGVVAVGRPLPDGTVEKGFRVFIGGGLGANPHPAIALEEFTPRDDLLATIEAVLRTFDHYGNRDNKLRARLKWVMDQMGPDEVKERVLKERRFLIGSVGYPGGVPAHVLEVGDAPAGMATGVEADSVGYTGGVSVTINGTNPFTRWEQANVIRGTAKGTVSAVAYARLGDVTSEQFRALAAIQREFNASVRLTNRQNIAFRDLTEEQIPQLYERLAAIGMAEPGAELARDVVSCPGADTCNLAVTQSRGLAAAIGDALEEAGLGDVGGIRINISGCTNSCGQHHVSDLGFMGVERRAHGQSAPGYQMLLGGHLADTMVAFGQKALRLPAKNCGEAAVRVVSRYANERSVGETFPVWMERIGGVKALTDDLRDLDWFPQPDEGPEYYVDYDETGPYEVELGESECAT